MDTSRGPVANQVSDRVAEQCRTFLHGLFMSLRTAQIHDTSNQAFKKALLSVHETADTLYKSTGGFRIQFVEEAVFINGARIRLERSAFTSMRSLKAHLEERQVGGIAMSGPPSFESIERLVLGLASKDDVRETALNSGEMELLGIQAMAEDSEEDVRIDRRILAIQSYGKLILAMRDQLEHATRSGTELPQSRIRIVRVIQDIVELVGDRADFILRLATNRQGTDDAELHGVSVALLSVALGSAIGLPRRDLVNLGVTAMFHHIACHKHRFDGQIRLGRDVTLASLGHLMYQSGAGSTCHDRAIILSEHRRRARDLTGIETTGPNVHARILGLATAYAQLCTGFGTRANEPAQPLEVLGVLARDRSGRFDLDLVDLLLNVMRAFPEGVEVVLDDGNHAVVDSHLGSSRWDRPVVKVIGSHSTIDLMRRNGDRFEKRIIGTPRFCGKNSRRLETDPVDDALSPVGPFDDDMAANNDGAAVRESVDSMLRDFLAGADGDGE